MQERDGANLGIGTGSRARLSERGPDAMRLADRRYLYSLLPLRLDGPANCNSYVFAAAIVECILQEVLAHLPCRFHGMKSCANLLGGDMLGEPLAAKQVNIAPGVLQSGEHRDRVFATNCPVGTGYSPP